MRVIEATRFGGPEVLVPVQRPDPAAGPGQLVVAATASDVMFVDTMIRAGRGTDITSQRITVLAGLTMSGPPCAHGE